MQHTLKLMGALLILAIVSEGLVRVGCAERAKTTEVKTNSSTSLEESLPTSSELRPTSGRKSRASQFRQLSYIDPLLEDRAKQIESSSSHQKAPASAERTQARNLYQSAEFPGGAYQASGYTPEVPHYQTSSGNYEPSYRPNVGYAQLPARPYPYAPVSSGYQQPESGTYQQQQQQQQQNYAGGQPSPYVLYRDHAISEQPPRKFVSERVFELMQPSAKFYFTSLRKNHHKNRQDALKTVVSFKESDSRVEEIEPGQVIQPDFYVQEDVLPAFRRKPHEKFRPQKSTTQKPPPPPPPPPKEALIESEEKHQDQPEPEKPAPKVEEVEGVEADEEEEEEEDEVEEAADKEPAKDSKPARGQDDDEGELRLRELIGALERASKKATAASAKVEQNKIADKDQVQADEKEFGSGSDEARASLEFEIPQVAAKQKLEAQIGAKKEPNSSESRASAEGSLEGLAALTTGGAKEQQAAGKDPSKKVFDAVRVAENVLGDVLQKVEKERADGLEGALLKKEQQKALEEVKKDSLARSATQAAEPGATGVKVCTSIEDC